MRKGLFTIGKRGAVRDWALNLSVLFLSAGLVSEAFSQLPGMLRGASFVAGLVLMLMGVVVAPDEGGR